MIATILSDHTLVRCVWCNAQASWLLSLTVVDHRRPQAEDGRYRMIEFGLCGSCKPAVVNARSKHVVSFERSYFGDPKNDVKTLRRLCQRALALDAEARLRTSTG